MAMLQSFSPAQCCNGLKKGLHCAYVLNLLHYPFHIMLRLP